MKKIQKMQIFVGIICAMSFIPVILSGQGNCYISLQDASGVTPTAVQLSELEQAACRLIDSLPAAYQDSFKVFSGGFYLHQEHAGGGFPEAFQRLIDAAAAQSTYYLLFGKQTDKGGVYTKFWVSINLPKAGDFACLTEAKLQELRFYLENVVATNYQSHNNLYHFYHESEIAAISFLSEAVKRLAVCCQIGTSNCSLSRCLSKVEIKEMLQRKGFRKIPIEILVPAATKPSNAAHRSNILGILVDSAGLQIKVKGEEVDLGDDFLAISNRSGQNFKCFLTKDENICPGNYFARAESDFMTPSQAIGAIWFHIFDDEIDYLYIKWIEYGKQKSDIFGLEHIFYQEGYFPYNGNQQNPTQEDRIINIDNNGLIVNVVPHKDLSSPATIGTVNRIPKIKTHTNEVVSLNDAKVDDELIWNYYTELVLSPDADVTDIQEKIIFERVGFSPDCHKGPNPTCRLYCNNYPFFYNYSQVTINQFYADGGIVGMGWWASRYFAKSESPNCGKMDYWCRYLSGAYKFASSANPLPCPHQYFLMELETISPYYRFSSMKTAYNLKDFGNFIWGGAMKKLGFSKEDALFWADWNEAFTDSEADKRAISAGYDNITN
jgi:hypothetical protein